MDWGDGLYGQAGIYLLSHLPSGNTYIGASSNLGQRLHGYWRTPSAHRWYQRLRAAVGVVALDDMDVCILARLGDPPCRCLTCCEAELVILFQPTLNGYGGGYPGHSDNCDGTFRPPSAWDEDTLFNFLVGVAPSHPDAAPLHNDSTKTQVKKASAVLRHQLRAKYEQVI
jgi:hypothetical protein